MEVNKWATERKVLKEVTGKVYVHGGTTGAELRRKTAPTVAT